jgi:hypothetical protein
MAQHSTNVVAGVSGLAVGAALMYAFDPERGRARRARLLDRARHAEHGLTDIGRSGVHDLANRGRGLMHDIVGVGRRDYGDDDIIGERVRAHVGRAIMHPGAVEVNVRGGVVTLKGRVLRAEVPELVHAVKRVRGVQHVVDKLDIRDQPGTVGALQGWRTYHRQISPGLRLLLLAGVGSLVVAQAVRRFL